MTSSDRPLLHICCAPADRAWVHGWLIPALGLQRGQFLTRADDELGALQSQALEVGVEHCRYTLLIASSAARHDQATQFAARLAQQLGLERGEPRLIVMALGPDAARDHAAGAEPARSSQLPLGQRALVALACPDEPGVRAAIAQLREWLALPPPVDRRPDCPYPGPVRFDRSNRHLMSGRDRDRDRVLARIGPGHGRLLLAGPPGVGKSSLIHAKVLPELSPDRHVVSVVPRGEPLAAAVLHASDRLEVPGLAAALVACAAAARGATPERIAQDRTRLPAPPAGDSRHRVFVIDPLDDVFAEDAEARDAAFDLLGGLWSQRWCTVVMCVCTELVDPPSELRCGRELRSCRYTLGRLDRTRLRAAITEPAAAVGVHVDGALVEQLIGEVDRDRAAVALPLLQLALQQLWTRLRWRYLSLADYERLGDGDQPGLAAVLAVHADAVLQRMAPGDASVARRTLLDLVHPGEGRPPTRRRRTVDQLRRRSDAPGQLQRVLAALIEGRLVTIGDATDGDVPGGRSAGRSGCGVDLAHDWLVTGWSELADWIRDHGDDLRTQRRREGRAAAGAPLSAADLPEFTRCVKASAPGDLLEPSDALRALVRRSTWTLRRRRAVVGLGAAAVAVLALWLQGERGSTALWRAAALDGDHMLVADFDRAFGGVVAVPAMREDLRQRAQAAAAEQRELGKRPEDAHRAAMVAMAREAERAMERGHLDQATARYGQVLADARRRVAAAPRDLEAQRDLTVTYNRLGAIALKVGRIRDAERWFGDAYAIVREFAAKAPENPALQRDLALAYAHQGELASASGAIDDARGWLERSREARCTLAAAGPDDAERQRDVMVSYNQLGNIEVKAGREGEARSWFHRAREIAEALANAAPGDLVRRYDLAVAYQTEGEAALRARERGRVRHWLDRAAVIRGGLIAADPSNAQWRQALSDGYEKRGELAQDEERFEEAGDWFKRVIAIREATATADPSHAGRQRDLAAAIEHLGIIEALSHRPDDALRAFERALAIRKAVANIDPSNPVWQRDVSNDHVLVSVVARDPVDAKRHIAEARGIHDQLTRDRALRGDAEFVRLASALDELNRCVWSLR